MPKSLVFGMHVVMFERMIKVMVRLHDAEIIGIWNAF